METIRRGTSHHSEFHKSRFKYDEVGDCYICPMGKLLRYKGLLKRKEKPDIRIYRCWDCPGCKRKSECHKAKYRATSLDPREYLVQRMRARLATKKVKKKRGNRE